LASANDRFDWSKNRRYLIIDNSGASDLLKAELNNVAGIPKGTIGTNLLKEIKNQALEFGNVEIKEGRVIEAVEENGLFTVKTESGETYKGDILVLATGFHEFSIKGLNVEVIDNIRAPRPGKVMVKHDGNFKVRENLWVAGNIAGCSTMFAAAIGSGAQVACDIMSKWAGKNIVIHDVPSK
ncbi:MAG: NAD(P)/FAD-dependent oxidoreductase, partial [Hydrogenothermus sp.]